MLLKLRHANGFSQVIYPLHHHFQSESIKIHQFLRLKKSPKAQSKKIAGRTQRITADAAPRIQALLTRVIRCGSPLASIRDL
jgi:hypothetical protein